MLRPITASDCSPNTIVCFDMFRIAGNGRQSSLAEKHKQPAREVLGELLRLDSKAVVRGGSKQAHVAPLRSAAASPFHVSMQTSAPRSVMQSMARTCLRSLRRMTTT